MYRQEKFQGVNGGGVDSEQKSCIICSFWVKRRVEMRLFLCICLYTHKTLGRVVALGMETGKHERRMGEMFVTV